MGTPAANNPPEATVRLGDALKINPAYIKAVNLPSVTFGYDNDAANIGSDGPNIESQDPTMTELELQFYMFPDLASDMQDIFYAYYLQNVTANPAGTEARGSVPRILNKDRVSLKPSRLIVAKSQIIVNIYDPQKVPPTSAADIPGDKGAVIRSLKYYGVYPVSYDLGTLEYGSSDILEGSMKFYFHGVEVLTPNQEVITPNDTNEKYKNIIMESFAHKEKRTMGDF